MFAAKPQHKQCLRRADQEATLTDRRKWRERPRQESGHCRKTPQPGERQTSTVIRQSAHPSTVAGWDGRRFRAVPVPLLGRRLSCLFDLSDFFGSMNEITKQTRPIKQIVYAHGPCPSHKMRGAFLKGKAYSLARIVEWEPSLFGVVSDKSIR